MLRHALLRARRERPCSRSAAKQPDELPSFHSLPSVLPDGKDSTACCAAGFQLADVSSGSLSTFSAGATCPLISAMPPTATQSLRRGETSRCANCDLTHCSKKQGYSITSSVRASSIGGTSK